MSLDAVTDALKKLTHGISLIRGDSPSSDKVEDQEYFCVEDTFLSKDIDVTVEGIGKLNFPLTENEIKNIINVSSKAKFGRGEETVLDVNVRDTQVIPASKLNVTIDDEALKETLERIGSGLNISSENGKLVPHLFNMLIYGPGQFFKMHRDSEKIANMVATLVIVLPSAHKGGDLIIQHGNKKHVFFGSKNPGFIKCVVFYSDCKHEIKEVTEGFRVALTYNVVMTFPETISTMNIDESLNNAVDLYFRDDDQPTIFAYYLNHSYSKHSLKWDLLKGKDRTRAFSLLAVAKKQGRIPYLALADCNKTYDLNDDSEELDSDTNLTYWVDEKNIMFKENCNISESEICYTIETTDLFEPYKTEETGYTGNEGETKDHWYRRACVVLWSNKWLFSNSFQPALRELHKLTACKGNEKLIIKEINKAGEQFFQKGLWNGKEITDMLLNIAIYLGNTTEAILIISKLPHYVLNKDEIDRCLRLEKQYDEETRGQILKSWKEDYGWYKIVDDSIPFIEEYTKKYCVEQLNSLIIKEIFKEAVKRFINTKDTTHHHLSTFLFSFEHVSSRSRYVYGRTEEGRIEKLCRLLKICADLESLALKDELIHHVISTPSVYPAVSVAELFLKIRDILLQDQFVQFTTLRDSALSLISEQMPLINDCQNNWYLPITIPCTCKFCSCVQDFFHSKTDKRVVVPAKKEIRRHVYSYLNPLVNYPIKFYTERVGSPLKIVIEKDSKLITDKRVLLNDLNHLKKKLEMVTCAEPQLSEHEDKVMVTCEADTTLNSQVSIVKTSDCDEIPLKRQKK